MAVSRRVNHGKKRTKRSIHQIKEIKANKAAKRRELAFRIILHVLYGITLLFGVAILSISIWYQNTLDISFNNLLMTVVTPTGSVNEGFLNQMLSACILPTAIAFAVYVVAVLLLWKNTPTKKTLRTVGAILCDVIFVASLICAIVSFRIPEYLELIL